jgi:hypothetical protein
LEQLPSNSDNSNPKNNSENILDTSLDLSFKLVDIERGFFLFFKNDRDNNSSLGNDMKDLYSLIDKLNTRYNFDCLDDKKYFNIKKEGE